MEVKAQRIISDTANHLNEHLSFPIGSCHTGSIV